MTGMMFGVLAGAAVVWLWRDQLAAQLEQKTHALRTKAAEGLESAEKQAEALLDRAKPQVTNALRAGSEAVRPSEKPPQPQPQQSPQPQGPGREPSRRVS